jgi:hypothetical protein
MLSGQVTEHGPAIAWLAVAGPVGGWGQAGIP